MSEHQGRTSAEWVTFGVAVVVLLAVAGLLVVQLVETQHPAAPVAKPAGDARESGGHFSVPVDVVNQGDRTAAQVHVTAELTIAGEVVSGDQTIDFLAGEETETLTFVFDDNPAAGELTIRVTGFADP